MRVNETARTTITLPQTTKGAIEALADRMGISFSSATQHLIKLGLTAEAIAYSGGEIVANYPSGEQRTLADRTGNYTHRVPLTSLK